MLVPDYQRLQGLQGGLELRENALWVPRGIGSGCRLSVDRTRAVPNADKLAQTKLYVVPVGNRGDWIEAWNGRDFVPARVPYDPDVNNQRDVTFLDLGMPQIANAATYDVFGKFNWGSGRWDLRAVKWNSTTARWASAPALPYIHADGLAMHRGVFVAPQGTAYASASPRPAPEWRFLGTIYASAAGQIEDSAAKRLVWNSDNRVARTMRVIESADSWAYSTASFRAANNNTANALDFVRGLDEDAVEARVQYGENSTLTCNFIAGVGLDSTTVNSGDSGWQQITTAAIIAYVTARWIGLPGLGRHVLTWLERGHGSGTQTMYGDNADPTILQSGIFATVMA